MEPPWNVSRARSKTQLQLAFCWRLPCAKEHGPRWTFGPFFRALFRGLPRFHEFMTHHILQAAKGRVPQIQIHPHVHSQARVRLDFHRASDLWLHAASPYRRKTVFPSPECSWRGHERTANQLSAPSSVRGRHFNRTSLSEQQIAGFAVKYAKIHCMHGSWK